MNGEEPFGGAEYERITFHFEGDLADEHYLNFYESARFQYAASRLVAKLANFQASGKIPQKITSKRNAPILLEAQSEGSFDISIVAPFIPAIAEVFITTPISSLMSYVFDRLLSKSDDESVAAALNAQVKVVETIGKISSDNAENMGKALDLIRDQHVGMREDSRRREEYLEQRISELERARILDVEADNLTKISEKMGQKLVAASAPLVADMATALRKSAKTLDIISESHTHGRNSIAFINKRIAGEIEAALVDENITSIRVDIIQYNKETGWGKARMHDTVRTIPFNVPLAINDNLKNILLTEMRKTLTFVQAYFVRDKAKDVTRLIIVGIIDDEPI